MIQESSNGNKVKPNFRTSLIKGELGEQFFREYLEKRGWVVYRPTANDKPHFCDIFASKGKREFLFADVKTKARLNMRNATGIDYRSYLEYLNFATTHTIPFYLVFINDKDGDVHYANILDLETSKESFRISNDSIICWPVSEMKLLFTLTEKQVSELSLYDQRGYDYNPIE